jgi:hypothetical protein
VSFSRPALVTGTSSEFLGARPLPRVLGRPVVWVLGPSQSGRTTVALRLAGPARRYLDTTALQHALAHRVQERAWPRELLEVESVVLDGPCWLGRRTSQARALGELLSARLAMGCRTIVVQWDGDPSLDGVLKGLEPGAVATLGLRFPAGVRGRRRAVRRICAEMGLPTSAGRGLSSLEPWTYARVRAALDADP